MTTIFEAHGHVYTKCCATCKHWQKSTQIEFKGACKVSEGQLSPIMITLDLSLCSRWEEKEDAE